MAFRTVEEASKTMQPGDRVVSNGNGLYLVESPAPSRGSLARGPLDSFWKNAGRTPVKSRAAAINTRSTASEDMGRPMTRGERAEEDVRDARESGRRPGRIKSAIAFLHRRGIIK